jgi:hypothetical protein
MTTLPLTNFSKGEISPELQARIDTAQYEAGAKRLRNFIIQRYGGASFRPGFRLVGELDSITSSPRYLPFQYNVEQAYIMALDEGYMRLLALGGMVLEDNLRITAITKAANAQITAAFHAYLVGEKVYFHGVTGMTEINGRTGTVVSVIDADNFTVNLDTTGFTTFVSSDGIVRGGAPAPTPAPTPPPVPPALPAEATSTDLGGSGADLGEGERRYDDGTLR